MENASQALIISGGVLIAILILSIGVLLYMQFNRNAETYTTRLDETELQKYNSNFVVYAHRTNVVAQDIITVINIAQQQESWTRVFLKNNDITDWSEEQKNDFLEKNILIYHSDDNTAENTYSCTSIDKDENGRVIKITFVKN